MLGSFRFYVLFPKQTVERRGVKAQQQKTEQAKNAVKQTQATNINPNVTPAQFRRQILQTMN
jgi:YidC/Oxa1 family membrane protein insertase